MTSLVTVTACCSADLEVVVNITTDFDDNNHVLQNGSSGAWYVSNDKAILVYEQLKIKGE